MSDKKPSPNDQRSTSKNPSSKEHWRNEGNRGRQMDPKQGNKPGNDKK